MVMWEDLDALSHQLELCAINASTRVVAVASATTTDELRELLRIALARIGAVAVEVVPIRVDDDDLLPAILDAADVVIDCRGLDRLPFRASSASVLRLGAAAPREYPPHANLRSRVQLLTTQLESASLMQLSDPNGTALRIDLQGAAVGFDHGMLGDNAPEATFPAGWVDITVAAQTVNGVLVVMPGDGNVDARRLIGSPIRLEVRNDRVSAIDGDHPDADVLRALFEQSGDPNAYAVATVALGMNSGSGPLGTFDDRLVDAQLSRLSAGIVSISFGENLLADRPCDQTIRLALPGRSVAVDDLAVIKTGQLQGGLAPDVYELP